MIMNNVLFGLIVLGGGFAAGRFAGPLIGLMLSRFARPFGGEAEKTARALSRTPYSLLIMCAVWHFGLKFAGAPQEWRVFLAKPVMIVFSCGFMMIGWQLLDILERYLQKILSSKERDTLHKHFLPYGKKILKIAAALIIGLFALQNIGFNITSLLASLGIGGIAVALGARETLRNLFGGLVIVADKPFAAGDWILCNGVEGTVEDIGFRSTKVKTFYDSLITIPNAAIADSTVDNLGRRKARRTRFTLSLNFETAPEEMEAFVEGIRNILLSNSHSRKDYFQVYFSGLGDSGLEVFVNFFLKVPDWDTELLQKQNIFLEILRLARRLKISFAFPTRTLDIPYLPAPGAKERKPPLSAEALKEGAGAFGPGGRLSRPEGAGVFSSGKKPSAGKADK